MSRDMSTGTGRQRTRWRAVRWPRAKRWLRAAVPMVAVLTWLTPVAATPATASPPTSCDWPMYGHDPSRTGSTSCGQAPDGAAASRLVPRWFFHANDVVTASPTIVQGTVYAGAWDGRFYALDLKTGRLHWSTQLGRGRTDSNADQHTGAYGEITSSAAVTNVSGRRVAFVGGGGSMYALDASRDDLPDARRVLWRFDVDASHPTNHGEVESSPVVWTGAPGGPVVVFGADSNQDSGFTGEGVWAVRADTGRLVWHFNPEAATNHALYGCGNVWSSPALGLDPRSPDPRRRAVLYFGTADCPDNTPTACPADGSDPHCPAGQQYAYARRWQRFADGIIAISASDGSPVWSYQPHPVNNTLDDDFGSSAQLFTLPGGRQAIGEGNKDGLYYVLDRNNGSLIWKRTEQGNGNVQTGFAVGGFLGATAVTSMHGVPRVFGGSAIDTPVTYNHSGQPVAQPDPTLALHPMQAFSGVDGSGAWSATQGYTYGATSVANGVVYLGALDGIFRAYNAATGSLLWASPLSGAISSGPAVSAGVVVIGAGTSDTDAEFKTCDHLPQAAQGMCRSTPLSATLNPLSAANGIWAFSPA
jgi:polyvinyl alcohol dehydrogenase (cytochrome)